MSDSSPAPASRKRAIQYAVSISTRSASANSKRGSAQYMSRGLTSSSKETNARDASFSPQKSGTAWRARSSASSPSAPRRRTTEGRISPRCWPPSTTSVRSFRTPATSSSNRRFPSAPAPCSASASKTTCASAAWKRSTLRYSQTPNFSKRAWRSKTACTRTASWSAPPPTKRAR